MISQTKAPRGPASSASAIRKIAHRKTIKPMLAVNGSSIRQSACSESERTMNGLRRPQRVQMRSLNHGATMPSGMVKMATAENESAYFTA